MGDEFCGWYFRCQSGDRTVALIPAVHAAGGVRSGSVQLITDTGNWNVPLPPGRIELRTDRPCAALGGSTFSEKGIRLHVQAESLSAEGELWFDALTPLRYDIMGPFRWVPFMECRHNVFSMRHRVNGRLTVNGDVYIFRNGTGYIEGDRGRSFPRAYMWTQCAFPGGALMLSAAEIPLGPVRFTGVIGAVLLQEKEYRLATYLGAKAVKIGEREIVVRQGNLTLTARLLDSASLPLRAPANGAMTRTIRENVACRARYCLERRGQTLLELETDRAAFEWEYP